MNCRLHTLQCTLKILSLRITQPITIFYAPSLLRVVQTTIEIFF